MGLAIGLSRTWRALVNNDNEVIDLAHSIYYSLPETAKQYYIDSSEKDLILQLDIEGGEYLTLLSTPIDFLKRFRILVVEFHSFHRVRNDYFLENIAIPVFEKLERVFDIVHLHPNNDAQSIPFLSYYLPHALEVTFHNKERRISRPLLRQFIEHDLDNPTVQNKEDVIFDSKLFS